MKGNINEYALTAGLLLMFMSLAHAVYGEAVVFSDLRFLTFDRALFATVYVPWHQMSLVFLISSVGLIFSSFRREHRSIQTFVLFVVVSNIIIFVIAVFSGAQIHELSTRVFIFLAWPQFFFFLVLVLLITLGIRRERRANTDL
jgi:hypothetical protein